MVVSILILSSILKDYIGDIYLCPGRDKTFRLNTANAFLNWFLGPQVEGGCFLDRWTYRNLCESRNAFLWSRNVAY